MLWLGCGGSIRENPVPNLDCDSAQATGEVRLTPNFANHLIMLFKYGLHQKSHIPGLLLIQPPLKFCSGIRYYSIGRGHVLHVAKIILRMCYTTYWYRPSYCTNLSTYLPSQKVCMTHP